MAEPAASGASLPRVLLVEDDDAVRRYVAMALDGMPIRLSLCANAESAWDELDREPVQLLITDLMMPGVSGLELLQRLAADRGRRPPARVVVFSAGIDAAVRAQLQALGVWRLLGKPTSLAELEDCVRDGLAPAEARSAEPAPADASAPAAAGEAAAIATHFGGNARLFLAFRASCAAQFGQDVKDVEAALASRDAAGLRRQMHSLKSVLSTLGQEGLAQCARSLEAAALSQRWDEVPALWAPLRSGLLALALPG